MKKIMFDDKFGLTRAVLEGRKTMTRRVVPECRALDILRLWEQNEGAVATGYEEKTQSFRFDYCPDKKRRISIDHLNIIPSYKVGEVVAVAQKYSEMNRRTFPVFVSEKGVFKKTENCVGWNNKMYVKADLMPHQIRITDIRVERLQDISDEDCLREGISKPNLWKPHNYTAEGLGYFEEAREAFATLIDKISGKGTFESNPWVYVYEFELVK